MCGCLRNKHNSRQSESTSQEGLCKYKDVFGKPDEGLHSYRIPIINLAAVDLILTLLLGYVIVRYLPVRMKTTSTYACVFMALIVLGVIVHYIFCVDTQLNKYLLGPGQ